MRNFTIALSLTALPAFADVPHVIVDIAPIHSLTAQVMQGVGSPDLLVEPGADVHNLTLRPSVAGELERAQVVIRVGDALTPWLAEPLQTLAADATILTLMEVSDWDRRAFESDEDEGHNDHDDHADHENHDNHDDHSDHATHDHGAIDPHAWLDPQVAAIWLDAIRDTLSQVDPDNADTYADNAQAATLALQTLEDTIERNLLDRPSGTWLAPHDAYGYFEDRFSFPSAGSVADSDAAAPGPAHLTTLRQAVMDGQVTCVLTETGANDNRARTLTEGTDARTARIDPTGAGLTPGPALYEQLLTGLSQSLRDCTDPER